MRQCACGGGVGGPIRVNSGKTGGERAVVCRSNTYCARTGALQLGQTCLHTNNAVLVQQAHHQSHHRVYRLNFTRKRLQESEQRNMHLLKNAYEYTVFCTIYCTI